MAGLSYPSARVVAERIQARLATNTTAFRDPDDAPKPDAAVIEEVISAAFWASLLREEGRSPTISLVFVPPEQVHQPLTFATRLRLEPNILARLAPAVERPGIHLAVWWYEDQLCVWGTTRSVPTWCFVLEVVAPGLLVVKYRRPEPTTKFANIAVLEGADVKFIEQQVPVMAEAPAALSALLAFYSSAGHDESDNILVRLAVSMRAHRHGGSLLVVPQNSDEWRNSIMQPMSYSVNPPFSEIDAIEALAGLTAVDGATLINDHFELLAFGVKIVRRQGGPRVERVLVTEPIEDSRKELVEPSQLGNTRHLSAAQFISDQRDAIALVASQDGRFTVFAWSPLQEVVHARRLEALLL
jgi:DNA integrity scanning protein DisA with diadenylate cyclase activity